MTLAEARKTRNEQRRIGPYRIARRLADGGMGRLYLAQDPELPRQVVLKTLRAPWSADDQAVARLKREAEILGGLDHPGVLRILDVLRIDGSVVLVLPYVEGFSLREVLDAARAGRPTSVDLDDSDAVLRLVEHTARAVHEVHTQGVVHRDLKPGNVMVQPDGRPVVLDFGLATPPSAETAHLTLDGQRVGTPPYMAPEQIRGEESRVGPEADVYALCALLFELLTLERAFAGDSLHTVYERVLSGDWSRDSLPQRVHRDLRAVLEKGLSLDSSDRYPSALELAEELRKLRHGQPTDARPTPLTERLWRSARRHPWTVLAASLAIFFAGAAAALGVTAWKQHRLLEAAQEYHAHAALGLEAPADVVQTLRDQMPTRKSASLFLARPHSPEGLASWLDAAAPSLQIASTQPPASPEHHLGLADDPSGLFEEFRILPTGATLDARPQAVCMTGLEAEGVWDCRLAGDQHTVLCIRSTTNPDGEVCFDLPDDLELEPGQLYSWKFRFRGRLGETEVEEIEVQAPITRIDRQVLQRQLAGYQRDGPPSVNQLPRSAVFLSLDLAQEALDELESIEGPLKPFALAHRDLLEARAQTMLGNRTRAEESRVRYLEAIGESSR